MSQILRVDDDENLLHGCHRALRAHFNLTTARSPQEALGVLESKGPYAVVVSDLRMPGDMDGIAFLARVQQAFPETVRVMLTGFADVKAAIDAVNQGHVFRFLTKPCPSELLGQALQEALRQYYLARSRFELLETQLCLRRKWN